MFVACCSCQSSPAKSHSSDEKGGDELHPFHHWDGIWLVKLQLQLQTHEPIIRLVAYLCCPCHTVKQNLNCALCINTHMRLYVILHHWSTGDTC